MFIVTDPSTPVGNCQTGEVRLQGGLNVREGRVEVCINNAWGTVCSDQFGFKDAIVTCAHMNFSAEGTRKICIVHVHNDSYLCTYCRSTSHIYSSSWFF